MEILLTKNMQKHNCTQASIGGNSFAKIHNLGMQHPKINLFIVMRDYALK